MNSTLYNQDYYLWLEQTVQLLREGKFSEIDINSLMDEIGDMARKEKKEVKSNLRILLMHLLKWKYQPEKRANSWRSSIVEQRKRIRDSFEDSPSLKPYFVEVFGQSYQDARELAEAETGLLIDIFPEECPFTQEEVLNSEYLPD